MKFGDIFRSKTKQDPLKMTIIEIERATIKKSGRKIVTNIVVPRGNVFEMKDVDIDKVFDKAIASL